MTPLELCKRLREVVPAGYEVFDPYEDGTIEMFADRWTDDGDGINVSVEMADDGLVVTEDGWHTNRVLGWYEYPISAETKARIAELAESAGAETNGVQPLIRGLSVDQVPAAVERMAGIILQITRLRPSTSSALKKSHSPEVAAD